MKVKVLKGYFKAQKFSTRCMQKLREKRGNGEHSAAMVLVLIAIVVGGVILLLFGDTVKSMWQTIQTKVATMFSYT